jgi:hypothetical protein
VRPTASLAVHRFYARHAAGAIDIDLTAVDGVTAVRARVYRDASDRQPAVAALASLRLPDRYAGVNGTDRALGDAESRAILQALAVLGLADDPDPDDGVIAIGTTTPDALAASVPPPGTASKRVVMSDPYDSRPASAAKAPRSPSALVLRERVADLDALLAASARWGVRPHRIARWRQQLRALSDAEPETLAALDRAERRLRRWLAREDLA